MTLADSSLNSYNKPGGYISKIQFNDDSSLKINENDIIVFVGPNNTGKSQSLKDIYELCNCKKPTIIVNDIEITKSEIDISSWIQTISSVKDNGNHKQYTGLGYSINSYGITGYRNEKYYGSLQPLFVTYLDTLTRLTISNPADAITRNSSRKHPIHFAAIDPRFRKWLSDNFRKAFGEDLIPNVLFGAQIPLCIGKPIKFDSDFIDEHERLEAYASQLDSYKHVHNQGDGIRSFTGILLYLMMDYFCTFLIDEPESFLHPPQANIMGRIIGETLTNQQQAFISTHSEEIIKGLLAVCPDRIKIVRITRENDDNSFSVLENDQFGKVWNDPLLKHSNIMSSLFHRTTVLCESDSDCRMYSIIDNQLKLENEQFSEALFIHCGGKQRMAKIVRALMCLNIEIKLIVDIDVLNNEDTFRNITAAFGIEWEELSRDYNIFISNLHSPKENIQREEVRSQIMHILDRSKNRTLHSEEISEINNSLRIISKWQPLKAGGKSAIPSGDATKAYNHIDELLISHGIYIVPVGELEGFIKEVGRHGPDWTNKVLEQYPDLKNDVYKDIREFVGSICK